MTTTFSSEPLSAWPRARVHLSIPELVEASLRQGDARLTATGAIVAGTVPRTGRSTKDRFIVRDSETATRVDWGAINQPLDSKAADTLRERVAGYLHERETFVLDAWAGTDPAHRLRVRLIAEYAWHALFAHQLFVRPDPAELRDFTPDVVIYAAPDFHCDPVRDAVRSDAAIVLDLTRRVITVAGTKYAGEIKKGVFSLLNYIMPSQGVLPMHCGANVGPAGDVALFFGLSGTGKTTLSADPQRRLIGDDEHGWGDLGVFNFEGGCYAKCIDLSHDREPQIYDAIRFGAILENVPLDPITREPLYNDHSVTENTRVAYPVTFIDHAEQSGRAGHPSTVILLTTDAFGVLPPVARLTTEQALYYFLAGYTAKLAGTEQGLGAHPEATFSPCFAAPFLPLPPSSLLAPLRARLERHGTRCYLVNTGWTGGPYGIGRRIEISHTRALVRDALSGDLDNAESRLDPIFGLRVPLAASGVPVTLLNPRSTWADPEEYDRTALYLAGLFHEKIATFPSLADQIRTVGPIQG